MKGDFTRFTFDPKKHYSGVFKQQGRVDLDADWNEYVEMQGYLDQIINRDIIGLCGVPYSDDSDENKNAFLISGKDNGDLLISPGRIYVDGILCELEKGDDVTYLNQPDYASKDGLYPDKDRTYLIYLDVWYRHMTAIEDPMIREKALGGPDTATRLKTVWQVKVLKGVAESKCEDFPFPHSSPSGRLSTMFSPVVEPKNCIPASGVGYTGLENRLYRIEIHDGGFKWSRDNGSIVFPIKDFDPQIKNKITLSRLGLDQFRTLLEGDWVEVLDDATELSGLPGTMAKIVEIPNRSNFEIILSKDIAGYKVKDHAKVRRWDQKGDDINAITGTINVKIGIPLNLENGIQIQFSDGEFNSGDYWVFAARTTGEIDTPLVEALPKGIKHHYCKLALVQWVQQTASSTNLIAKVIDDCRKKFLPLTKLGSKSSNCFTVTVGDGVISHGDFDDIQDAVDSVKSKRGARVHILEGIHKLSKTVEIKRCSGVTKCFGVSKLDSSLLQKIAKTAMIGKCSQTVQDKLAPLAVEAVKAVVEEDGFVDIDNITVEKKVGCSIGDSVFISGVVIDKDRLHPSMPKKVTNARIALLNAAVEIEKTEVDANIELTSPDHLQAFLDQEETMLKGMVDKIAASGANVLFIQKGIGDIAQHYLAKAGIYTTSYVKKNEMEKVSRATGAMIVDSIDELSKDYLGKAGLVEERKIGGDDKMTFVEVCNNPKSVSIILCGSTEHEVDELDSAMNDALVAIEDNILVPGGDDRAPNGTKDFTIIGCGSRSHIIGPKNQHAFHLRSSNSISFDSLLIDVEQGQCAIDISNCCNIEIANCAIYSDQMTSEASLIEISKGSFGIIVENNCFYNNIVDINKFINIGINGNNINIFNNKLVNVGIWLHDGSKNIIIKDNSISGASAGIILGGKTSTSDDSQVAGITITDNFIVGMDNSGICTMTNTNSSAHVSITGQGVVSGAAIGKVRIIASESDLDKVEQGDIMVIKVTLPGMDQAMKRAGAIVTDECDMNCTAAIMDSKFDRPVIRTKTATSFLKDSMMVRVNGDMGIVDECQEALRSDIADLIIDRNRIFGCAKKGIDERFDNEAVGGIVLRDISGLRISGNHIIKNGNGTPACGVFVSMCQGLEVKDNLITDNGVTNDYKEPEKAYQAGIVALHITGGSLPAGYLHDLAEARLSGLRAGVPSATITDNVVVTPRGHALIIVGLGQMRIADNSLTTLGKWSQPVYEILNSKINQCVCIINYGISLELAAFDLSGLGEASVDRELKSMSFDLAAVPFVKLREVLTDMATLRSVNGQVLFHGNQVTFQTGDPIEIYDTRGNIPDHSQVASFLKKNIEEIVDNSIGSPIIIASGDDVSFQDNQILIEDVGDFVISSVTALAPTVRASCNRFSELIPSLNTPYRGSLISYLSLGYMNIATDNQATRCLLIFGPKKIQGPNQIAFELLCKEPRGDLIPTLFKMVSGLFEKGSTKALLALTQSLDISADAQVIRASRLADMASKMKATYGETHPNFISAQKTSNAADKLARSLRKMNDLSAPTIPMLHPKDWLVFGRVLNQDGKPAKGLKVQVFDPEEKRSDLLGNAGTDENGNFSIIYPYSPPVEGELPDLYLTVKDARGNVLFSSEKAMRYEADKAEYYEIVLEKAPM